MNNPQTELDSWLLSTVSTGDIAVTDVWEPIFDPDRHLVHTKIGPYWRLFIRPEGFIKRFYHRVYPMSVESWSLHRQLELFDGFCRIDVALNVRFQASVKYARNNMDVLDSLNEHIKSSFADLLISLIDKELLGLSDGTWVQKGVAHIEKHIIIAVNELLILHNIQSQTECAVNPWFDEFPEVQLARDHVYLCVLKKSYEFNSAKREELFRQEQQTEQQRTDHQQRLLEQLKHEEELERLKQAQEAEHKKRLLEEQQQQLLAQYEIEKQLHADQMAHESQLKEISLEAELLTKQRQEDRLRLAEQRNHQALLAHQAELKARELDADIAKYEVQQAKWREVKDKLHAQQMELESRQKQLELETDVEYQKLQEQRRLEVQRESYNRAKESDIYLRREIELLNLEKQRLELQLQIKDAAKKHMDES